LREPAENYFPTFLLYWTVALDDAALYYEAIQPATSDIAISIKLNGGAG